MFKRILVVFAMLLASICYAAVEINDASATELSSIKGIGAATSAKIVNERDSGQFKDWNDLITRVKGVGEGSAANFSKAGLLVNGEKFRRSRKK